MGGSCKKQDRRRGQRKSFFSSESQGKAFWESSPDRGRASQLASQREEQRQRPQGEVGVGLWSLELQCGSRKCVCGGQVITRAAGHQGVSVFMMETEQEVLSGRAISSDWVWEVC